MIYEEMILPCVELVKKREYEEVYRLYKAYTVQVDEAYGEGAYGHVCDFP